MELRHLRYFVVTAEEQNFHRAAKRLHVAPSALSRRISDLEYELGFQLFDRVRRRVRLSDAGAIFHARAAAILSDLELAGRAAKQAASVRANTLAIGFFAVPLSRAIISRHVRWLRTTHPDIQLALTPLTPEPTLAALRDRTIDGAFLPNPPGSEFARLKLVTAGWNLAVPDFHELAGRKSVRLGELSGYPFIWYTHFGDELLTACAARGLRPDIHYTVPTIELGLAYVAAGLGVSLVLDTTEVGKDMSRVEVEDLDFDVSMYFLWHEERQSEALRRFIAGLREYHHDMPARQGAGPAVTSRPGRPRSSAR